MRPIRAPSVVEGTDLHKKVLSLAKRLIDYVMDELMMVHVDPHPSHDNFQFGVQITKPEYVEHMVEFLKIVTPITKLTFKKGQVKSGGSRIIVSSPNEVLGFLSYSNRSDIAVKDRICVIKNHRYDEPIRDKYIYGLTTIVFANLLHQTMVYNNEVDLKEVLPLLEKAVLEIS